VDRGDGGEEAQEEKEWEMNGGSCLVGKDDNITKVSNVRNMADSQIDCNTLHVSQLRLSDFALELSMTSFDSRSAPMQPGRYCPLLQLARMTS
jgi:hypothetical protein